MHATVRKHKKNIHFLSDSKLTYETEPRFNEIELKLYGTEVFRQNRSETEPNFKNPFRTSLGNLTLMRKLYLSGAF